MPRSLASLADPKVVPPLDHGFRPLVLAGKALASASGERCTLGLWRGDMLVAEHRIPVFEQGHELEQAATEWAERAVKFLLWQVGGDRVTFDGSDVAQKAVASQYRAGSSREFDVVTVGEKMFGRALRIERSDRRHVSGVSTGSKRIGRHLEGCRVGFDLGASDRKVAAVIDGETVFSEEVVWDPRGNSDPEYHKREMITGIRKAAGHMPRLDAIGGSTAGVVIDNRIMVSSLFRGVPDDQYHKARDIFIEVQREFGVPLEVANDGDVTALAGSMSLDKGRLLGIAMGSSLAGGYVDANGDVKGWLNELAFAPIDASPQAPADEWSGDVGCGVQYLTQQAVFRLAPLVGIDLTGTEVLAEKLKTAQAALERGDAGAERIWHTVGVYFGYAIAHYATFYDLGSVLLLGRVASGKGGPIIVEQAVRVLRTEFPELAERIEVFVPDERTRRVGQAVAAASLPSLGN